MRGQGWTSEEDGSPYIAATRESVEISQALDSALSTRTSGDLHDTGRLERMEIGRRYWAQSFNQRPPGWSTPACGSGRHGSGVN